MALDTARVSSTRVSSPPPGEAVLALSLHWGDRLVALEHLEPGARRRDVRWEGESARVQVPGGADVTVAPGEQVTAALPSGLTLTARLRRRELAIAATEPSGEQLLIFRVLAFATLGFIAAVAMMVVTPVVEDDESNFYSGQDPGASAHFVVPVPTSAPVFDAVPAKVDPGKAGAAPPRAASRPKAGKAEREAAARSLLDEMMGGPSTRVATAGFGGALNDALNALTGPSANALASSGLSGLGSRGTGPGAGPSGLGIGGVGTVGGRPGVGLAGLRSGHRDVVVVCDFPGTFVANGLGRDEVLRVVNRHQGEIRFCYESGLPQRPNLAGKLAVRWVISASGDVTTADLAESALDAADVESCVLSRVRRWRFPASQSETVVTFPWVFSVAGAGDEAPTP